MSSYSGNLDIKEMEEDIDCDYTEEIVCPYCGHVHRDSWDFFNRNDEDLDIECRNCGKELYVSRHIIIKYSTSKIEDEK